MLVKIGEKYGVQECGQEVWDGEDIFHSPLIGRHKAPHPPPLIAQYPTWEIQCSLFIVNNSVNNTESTFSPDQEDVFIVERWEVKVEASLLELIDSFSMQNVGKQFWDVYDVASQRMRR